MRVRLWLFILGLALLNIGAGNAQSQNIQIPKTQGTALAGNQITLPDDVRGKVGVLVLGFSQKSGDVCKGWGQRLAENYHDSHEVTYYQMPVLESVPKLIRGMVVKSIKSGVPNAEQVHFLPTFSNEAAWRETVHYKNPDTAYIVVIDGEGQVHWQTSGQVTEAGFTALKQQVEAARAELSSPKK
jgi:hypothetical protein